MSQLRIFSGSKASNQNGAVDQGPVGNRQQDQKLEKKKKKRNLGEEACGRPCQIRLSA